MQVAMEELAKTAPAQNRQLSKITGLIAQGPEKCAVSTIVTVIQAPIRLISTDLTHRNHLPKCSRLHLNLPFSCLAMFATDQCVTSSCSTRGVIYRSINRAGVHLK